MEFKHEFSKIEIATYLRDFFWMLTNSTINQNNSFFEVFQHYLKNDNRLQFANMDYYNEMIEIYEYMLISKIFTVFYDNLFEQLLESKIDSINIPQNIFVEKKDYLRFSKRNIINNIRIAINHNDNSDKLKIIRVNDGEKNNIKLEILLKETKQGPFHVVLDHETLISIIHEVLKSNTINLISFRTNSPIKLTSQTTNQELDKVFVRKFYSRKKILNEDLIKLKEILQENNKSKGLESILNSLRLEYKDYNLSIGQKLKIAEDLKFWESKGEESNDVLSHLVNKVMPLSNLKFRALIMNLCLTDVYIKSNKTIFDIVYEARKIYLTNECNDNSPLYLYVKEFGIDKNILYDAFDFENLLSITESIYYGYLFDTLIIEDEIEITDSKILPRNKMRNSFVHMRWFKGINECFKLFDWGNSLDDEFNSESKTFWKSNVKRIEMVECVEKYYNKKLNERATSESFLDQPIHLKKINLPNGSRKITGISFVKNSIFYFYQLNENSNKNDLYCLYVLDNSQIQRFATKDEIQFFISELVNLTEQEKILYRDIIESVPKNIRNSKENESNYKR